MKILNEKVSQKIESLTWDEINSILPCESGTCDGVCSDYPDPPSWDLVIWEKSF